MIRPLLSLERLSLDERAGKVCYRYEKEAREMEWMDWLLIPGDAAQNDDLSYFSFRLIITNFLNHL
jgi:hypothetical protein